MKYIAYCRKSTDEPDRQILSIEAQIAEVKEFAEREKLEIVDIIVESKTAKIPGRPEFNRVVKLLEAGKAQGIVAWHPDRLARNSVDGGQLIYLLDTGKLLDLKFPSFWFDNTPQGKFMLNIAFGQSKYYVDNLSENVKRGNRQKIRRGEWPNKAPIGYLNSRTGQTKTIEVDKKRAKFIRLAFEKFASGGFTFTQIRDFLADNQVFGNLTKSKIHKDTIRRILSNPFYFGLMSYQGELHQGKHQPIISKKLFDQVQKVIVSKSHRYTHQKQSFDFLGIAHCGECGCAITAEKHRKHYLRRNVDVDYHYYRCSKKKTPCHQSYLSSTVFDSQLRDIVYSISISPFTASKFIEWGRADAQKESADVSQNISTLTSAIFELDSKLDILLDIYLDKSIDQLEYQQKKNKLLNTKTQLLEQKQKLEAKGTVWLEPFEEFINCALRAQKIAHTKNNSDELSELAKTVGSNYFLLNKIITPKFKNDAFGALAATTCAARATVTHPFLPELLPRMDSNHSKQLQRLLSYH